MPSLINTKESAFVFIESNEPEEALQTIVSLVKDRLPKRFRLSPTKDIQLLYPMTKGTLGTKNLNAKLQEALIADNNNSISIFGITSI